MKKVYIYGAGTTGQEVYKKIKDTYEVKGFLDQNKKKWGTKIDNIPIIGDANSISGLCYDMIIVASLPGMDIICDTLLKEGVPIWKINKEYVSTKVEARLNFLRDFAFINKDKMIDYAVAEGGVFQGDFAKEINTNFPKSTLYLFDTFEGFDARDTSAENAKGYSESKQGHLANTSESLVISKLPHPEKAIIRKGYFPRTAKGLEDEKFFFVNLDFDLYQPILEGLRFFYPRLSTNGVLLVHDYFTPAYYGVLKAVQDYEKEHGCELIKLPIGDHCSIAIVKLPESP